VLGGRSAVLVDVGYLLGTAGRTLLNTTYRHYIRCDYRALMAGVIANVKEHSGMSVLRVYWYDAAYNAVPTYEQRTVATIPGVKLRLGRMVQGRQNGVDSLIVRDLMTLARERAMATAYLITGDEDVREGVAAAQDMGTRVVLLGLPGAHRAFTLLAEADEELVLSDAFWRPHFTVLTPTQMEAELPAELAVAEPVPEPTLPVATTPRRSWSALLLRTRRRPRTRTRASHRRQTPAPTSLGSGATPPTWTSSAGCWPCRRGVSRRTSMHSSWSLPTVNWGSCASTRS
jgi:uncharacterized LabA/DUF88 family protein